MDLYETPEGVEEYVAMAEGYDGRDHVVALKALLPAGSSVLELGMGPGKDLDMLAEHFDVVGSDNSQAFLDRYVADHPDAEIHHLDAVSIEVDRVFDAVYSNKVLQHLSVAELERSLARQAEIVRPGGLIIHGVWAGTGGEDFKGSWIQYYTCESWAEAAPTSFEMLECVTYEEMEPDDSLRIIMRRV